MRSFGSSLRFGSIYCQAPLCNWWFPNVKVYYVCLQEALLLHCDTCGILKCKAEKHGGKGSAHIARACVLYFLYMEFIGQNAAKQAVPMGAIHNMSVRLHFVKTGGVFYVICGSFSGSLLKELHSEAMYLFSLLPQHHTWGCGCSLLSSD